MSDLFRSALGYLSGPSQPGQGGSQGVNGGYSSASGGPSDDTNAVGEVVAFTMASGGRPKNVRITKLIAEGGFSYVFKGIDLQSGDAIAIKKMIAPDEEARKAVAQEKEFMGQFQHEHIARYFGSFMKSGAKNLEEHYLAMEFCPVQLPTPPLRLQHTTQVFAQVCRAIKYLHDFGIVHRDIKLENVLIGSDGLVKLVDFGSATMEKFYPAPDWSMAKRTIVEEQIAAKTTPMYRAPEMLDLWSNYPIDEQVDMWALGCLLFALNFGQHPFQDSNKLAIVNANYSVPKNVSDSGPIVTLIRGLLKVDPSERLTFGQIFEVLISIAESQGFSANAPLPFKAPTSPNTTGGGIVNPLAAAAGNSAPPPQAVPHHHHHSSSSGGGGSLFSSLKGGAASLIKNIKEQSQQYLAPVVPPPPSTAPPPRPAPPPTSSHPSRPPPPRPPPSPLMNQRKAGDKEHIEFENREYEAMNQTSSSGPPPARPTPPARPARPPSPQATTQHPKVANLLDMSFDAGPSLENSSSAAPSHFNADLLDDLFGGSSAPSMTTQDLFWTDNSGGGKPQSDDVDLLCDPVASLLGKSAPTSKPLSGFSANFGPSQPFIQQASNPQVMPQSASFQNLNAHGLSSGNNGMNSSGELLDVVGSGKIPKNSSSPNLLSDLILGDIMGTGGASTGGGGSSNPTLSNQQNNGKPNYNRTQIFDPPAQEKKQNLNDVFGDILSSQGFASSNKMDCGKTINDMRKIEMLANPNMNPTQIKVNEWREGKKKNIRALLSSLHTITWEGCHWEETNMSQMITHAQVKKTYRKACLAIHPDKQMGEEWEELAKMIFVELNEAWASFDESQQ